MGQGASIPQRSPRAKGAQLLDACRAADTERVDEILLHCPAAAAHCTWEGLSCLHVAASSGRADLLECLLDALHRAGTARQPKAARRSRSKAVNQKNVHGQTPLMLACKAGDAACVRLLLRAGADATLFDGVQERNCLHYAALYGWAEAIDALLEDASVVSSTAAGHQPQLLRDALIADSQGHHRYIDGRACFGLAPLHLAAHQGHLAAVQMLIKWGASLTVRCNAAFSLGAADPWTPASTPLHFAAARGRARVALAILQAAAERRVAGLHPVDLRLLQDFRGQRPYDVACAHGHRSLLWALNPRVPLEALLRPAAPCPAMPSLAALAAGALRHQLMRQLAELREAQSSQAAAEVQLARQQTKSGRRGGSQPASREGSGHGGSAAFAALSAAAAAAARLARGSGGRVSPHLRQGSMGPVPVPRHSRHASDSGIGGSMPHGFQPCTSVSGGRGTGSYASLSLAAQPVPLQLQPAGGSAPQGALAMAADGMSGGAAGSLAGCRTATSVTSVAGCPVCLDSCLEVCASPCGHGLCLECAQHLAAPEEGGSSSAAPPLCPLCRGLMAGFRLL